MERAHDRARTELHADDRNRRHRPPGEITGGGRFEHLLIHTVELEFFGHPCRCLDLPTLISVKRAAGRPRDLEVIAELEALMEERNQG